MTEDDSNQSPYRQSARSKDEEPPEVDPRVFCICCWEDLPPKEKWFQFVRHTLSHNKDTTKGLK